jgi:hypothetical protein
VECIITYNIMYIILGSEPYCRLTRFPSPPKQLRRFRLFKTGESVALLPNALTLWLTNQINKAEHCMVS